MFAETFRNLRINSGLHQAQIATQLGVSNMTISKWERGLNTPRGKALEKVCKLFNVEENVFFTNPSEKKKPEKVHTYVGSKIKELRQKNNMSQIDFGKKIGIANDVISGFECGRVTPTEKILKKIIKSFKLTKDYFVEPPQEIQATQTIEQPVTENPLAEAAYAFQTVSDIKIVDEADGKLEDKPATENEDNHAADTVSIDIGKLIRLARTNNGLTQKQFGEKIGVAHDIVSGFENNKKTASRTILDKIIKEFNLEENFFGEQPVVLKDNIITFEPMQQKTGTDNTSFVVDATNTAEEDSVVETKIESTNVIQSDDKPAKTIPVTFELPSDYKKITIVIERDE